MFVFIVVADLIVKIHLFLALFIIEVSEFSIIGHVQKYAMKIYFLLRPVATTLYSYQNIRI